MLKQLFRKTLSEPVVVERSNLVVDDESSQKLKERSATLESLASMEDLPTKPRRSSIIPVLRKKKKSKSIKIQDIHKHIDDIIRSPEGIDNICEFAKRSSDGRAKKLENFIFFIRDVETFRNNDIAFGIDFYVLKIYKQYISPEGSRYISCFTRAFLDSLKPIVDNIKNESSNNPTGSWHELNVNDRSDGIKNDFFDMQREIILFATYSLMKQIYIGSKEHKELLKSLGLKL